MDAWRITNGGRADLRGDGGLHGDGRWHSRGHRIIYAAGSPALALLEVLVHLVDKDTIPDDYVLMRINIPDAMRTKKLKERDLPSSWRSDLDETNCRKIGDAWLASGRTVVMEVPSVILPIERNVFINPVLPSSRRIDIREIDPFELDPRLGRMLRSAREAQRPI